MVVKIVSASFGDKIARRDVTASLQEQAEDGTLNVTANEQLIPAYEVSEETKLTQSDLNAIEKQAQEQCSGGADTDCLRATKAKLIEQKHAEKANTDFSSANTIAGRALTVTYVDKNNVTKRIVVPDGQKLNLEDVEFKESFTNKRKTKWERYQEKGIQLFGLAVWTAVFVFSVASAYRVFKRDGNPLLAVVIGLFAFLLPLGGAPAFVGILFVIAIHAFLTFSRQSKTAGAAAVPAVPNPLASLQSYAATSPLASLQNYAPGLLKKA